MAKTNLNIQIDEDMKKEAQKLFSECGIDITEAINIFLRKSIKEQGLPFDLKAKKPNKKTIEAMIEGDKMIKDPKAQKYSNVEELFKDLDA